jgi:hypothetical protein
MSGLRVRCECSGFFFAVTADFLEDFDGVYAKLRPQPAGFAFSARDVWNYSGETHGTWSFTRFYFHQVLFHHATCLVVRILCDGWRIVDGSGGNACVIKDGLDFSQR